MYRALLGRFGHQHWWPGDGAMEICVGAILTQNTNWRNVEKALANLRSAGCMSVEGLAALPHDRLAGLIRPAGYFNVKARRLAAFIARVHEHSGGTIEAFLDRPVEPLRRELLAVNGIGPETADSILLYAAGGLSFVVDAYTRRVLVRHGLVDPHARYEAIQDLFERSLPRTVALWNDFHAQFVAVGKHYCRPRARCEGCPLARFSHDAEARA